MQKGVHAILGCDPKGITQMKSGDLLIEVETPSQSKQLQKAKLLQNVPIKTSLHRSLNTCKGVVKHPQLKQGTESEIKENLSHLVTSVHLFNIIK